MCDTRATRRATGLPGGIGIQGGQKTTSQQHCDIATINFTNQR
ncbi:hypothetical protein C7S15_6284 [Burkholderia cepacia]|nr:hypothetical protein [Burkholderia cepacia]